jgi:crossover junction endodeoxyribonuclease RuvC
VPVHEYGPMAVKQALVGTGRASKEQVAFMVRGLLELPAGPASHHVADALALALTHLSARRLGSLVPRRG